MNEAVENWRDAERQPGHDPRQPTFEHIIPLGKGGSDTEGNLAIACYGCNHRRGADNEFDSSLFVDNAAAQVGL
jgi:hypothetical protein